MNRNVAKGDFLVWCAGGLLAVVLTLLFGLLIVVFSNGLSYYWPKPLLEISLKDGRKILGSVFAKEGVAGQAAAGSYAIKRRWQIKQGNRDLFGLDFVWLDEQDIQSVAYPQQVVAIERREWGDFYGQIVRVEDDGVVVAEGEESSLALLRSLVPHAVSQINSLDRKEKREATDISYLHQNLNRSLKRIERGESSVLTKERVLEEIATVKNRYDALQSELAEQRANLKTSIVLKAANNQEKVIPLNTVIAVDAVNQMSFLEKLLRYFGRLWDFLTGNPRESNTEGGVFPALFGTVAMVLLMSIVVAPLGVVTAIYLHEYAKPGPFVSLLRVCVNNLAGVPSIVYGVFGLGFFVYFVGGQIDQLLYADQLPSPTFGTGGVLWAALTLALLTLPTVIVTTEEGLAAIPRALREASYALGATKWETTSRVLLPSLLPALLTGLILAVARAAGEVAPLMVTGVVKLAPSLPIDQTWPFVHLNRKFMHLGFHIYDVGFQSPNVDAARPMVYLTTVLLLGLVLLLNLTAIIIRARLRRKYMVSGL